MILYMTLINIGNPTRAAYLFMANLLAPDREISGFVATEFTSEHDRIIHGRLPRESSHINGESALNDSPLRGSDINDYSPVKGSSTNGPTFSNGSTPSNEETNCHSFDGEPVNGQA